MLVTVINSTDAHFASVRAFNYTKLNHDRYNENYSVRGADEEDTRKLGAQSHKRACCYFLLGKRLLCGSIKQKRAASVEHETLVNWQLDERFAWALQASCTGAAH